MLELSCDRDRWKWIWDGDIHMSEMLASCVMGFSPGAPFYPELVG